MYSTTVEYNYYPVVVERYLCFDTFSSLYQKLIISQHRKLSPMSKPLAYLHCLQINIQNSLQGQSANH